MQQFGTQIGLGGTVGVSLHQQKPAAQCQFDILQQLKPVTVHNRTSLKEVSPLPEGRGC